MLGVGAPPPRHRACPACSWLSSVPPVASWPWPPHRLQIWKTMNRRFRVVVCGGDGTIGWIFTALEEEGLADRAEVAIVPLGTGNDLSRVLGWGKAADGSKVRRNARASSLLRVGAQLALTRATPPTPRRLAAPGGPARSHPGKAE